MRLVEFAFVSIAFLCLEADDDVAAALSVVTVLSSASFKASNPSIRFDCSSCLRSFNVDSIIRSFFMYCSRLINLFFCPLDNPATEFVVIGASLCLTFVMESGTTDCVDEVAIDICSAVELVVVKGADVVVVSSRLALLPVAPIPFSFVRLVGMDGAVPEVDVLTATLRNFLPVISLGMLIYFGISNKFSRLEANNRKMNSDLLVLDKR